MSWAKAILVSLFVILAPIHAVMATAVVLIIADLIFGVLAAYKRKEHITSAALRRTVSKVVVYEAALVLGYLAQHYMLADSLPLAKLAAAAIAMTEMKSIVENLNQLNGSNLFATITSILGSQNDKDAPK